VKTPSYRAAYRIRKKRRVDEVKPEAGALSLDQVALQHFCRPRTMLISDAAYYRSCTVDGASQDPIANWLLAEAEIDRMLRLKLDGRTIEHVEGTP
jgi:hypothetical protein